MTLIVKDTFTDTDGVALTAHTPDTSGVSWLVVEQGAGCAAPSIKSNALKIDGGANSNNETSVALPKSGGYGTNDYLVTATVNYTTNDTEEQFITARVATGAGAYQKYTFGWYRNGVWQLRKYTGLNGAWTALASVAVAFPSGDQTLVMRVVTIGGNTAIQCKANGTVVLATTIDSASPYLAGIAGVVGFNQSTNYAPTGIFVKDIQVDTIPTGAQDVLVSVAPAGAVAATTFGTQPSGTIADAYGAAVTGQADTVTVSVVSGPGTISGTLTAAVNTVNGAWAFTNLQLSLAGPYVLKFTSANGYAPSTVSFTVATKTANFSASLLGHAMSDAGMTPLDGAILELRDGTQPANTGVAATGTVGARITLENPGTYNWPNPYGVTVVVPTASVVGLANITPTWARLFASNGTTVLMDVTCSPTGVLVLSAATIAVGQRVQLEALVLYDPGFSVSVATQVSGEAAIGGTMDGACELPRVFVDTTPPTPALTKTVGLTGRDYTDLQAAITAAVRDTTLLVDAGYDYTPPGGSGMLLPPKAGANWIVIKAASLPYGQGTRMTPARAAAASLPKIRLDNQSQAVYATSQTAFYRLQGFEILPVTASPPAAAYNLVAIQPDNSTYGGQGNSYADMPHHIVIDQCYLHGNNAATQIVRAVQLNGDTCALVNSWVSDIIHNSADAQAVNFYMQKGPVKVNNNYLEATGECMMVGGAESVWPAVCVADIEVRYNTIAKDPAWRGVYGDIKTLYEMKGGRRVLFEGNDLKNNWNTAQAVWKGVTITLKTVSQNGSPTVGHWRLSDVTMRNNRISLAGRCFNLHPLAEPSKPATPAARFTYRNTLAMHMGQSPNDGTNLGAIFLDILPRATITDVLVDHCTFVYPTLGVQAINLGDYGTSATGGNGGVAGMPYRRTTIKNSIFACGGSFPITGRDTTYVDESLANYVGASSSITRCAFSCGQTEASGVPVSAAAIGNRFLVNTTDATYPEIGFTNLGADDYSLSVSSAYRAGGAFAALDGTDLGVNMTTLLAALAGGASTADHLAITTQPAGVVSGTPMATQPAGTVNAVDGSVAASDASTITATLVVESGVAIPLGATTTVASAGLWAFTTLGVFSALGAVAHWHFTDGALIGVDSASFPILPRLRGRRF